MSTDTIDFDSIDDDQNVTKDFDDRLTPDFDQEGDNELTSNATYEPEPSLLDETETVNFDIPAILDYPQTQDGQIWTLKLHSYNCTRCGYLTNQPNDFQDEEKEEKDVPDCHYTNGNQECPTGHISIVYANLPKSPSQIRAEKLIEYIETSLAKRNLNDQPRARMKHIIGLIEKYSEQYPRASRAVEIVEKHFFQEV